MDLPARGRKFEEREETYSCPKASPQHPGFSSELAQN